MNEELNDLKIAGVGNYEYFTDDEGLLKCINRSTGEVSDAVEQIVPIGTSVMTPDMRAAYIEYKKRKEENKYRKAANKDLGNFFFVQSNENFSKLSPQTTVRLIYLNTFADYETNRLMLKRNTPMQHKDLIEVLKISKAAVSNFWHEVCPKYVIEDESGLMFTNTEIFIKKRLSRRVYIEYQKFYNKGIRKLYDETEPSKHKHLGYIFKMLPYINFEYNLLCYNPNESQLEKLHLMSLADFCKEINYNVSNLNRLMQIYKNLRFDSNGIQERFCSFSYDGIDRSKSSIAVNPHILYNGSDYRKVEILGAFCK